MRRIESCEPNEIIRPVMDGWWCDGGGDQMWQSQEYWIHRHIKDPTGKERLYGPFSFVCLRDNAGLGYVLNYGRMVLGRLEPATPLGELATLPPEFWVSSNGQHYDNNRNRERFRQLIAEANAQGIKIQASKPPRLKSTEKMYSLNMANIASASSMPKQAMICLSLIIEAGKADGVNENDLAELLRANGFRLNTKQDPWKIFMFYNKIYKESGILSIEE